VIEVWGGMGDALLATPALRALKQSHPDLEIRVRCQENTLEILEHNPWVDLVSCRPDDPRFLGLPVTDTNYGKLYPSTSCRRHASDLIAELVGVTLEDRALVASLTEADEQKALNIVAGRPKPLSLHVTSGSLSYKNWPVDRWEQLVRRMPECTFIQLGEERDPPVAFTVDMRGMTTPREAIAVVKHTACFVGVDSFLNHATSAVGTPGVVLFGPSAPAIWGHPQNVNLYTGVECSPCVDTIGKNPCPWAHRCMTAIGVDEVERAIRRTILC
jgi:ADP-heptose:LPS heptosyltransferase